MKIKHWQGYGTVNAKKVMDNGNQLVVKVWGNHEYGLERDDAYDVYNWLVKRFKKDMPDYRCITNISIDDQYQRIDGITTEVAVYTISYMPAHSYLM